ncbi:MAG: ribosome biogenesis GTP-binding protein YihA/YsxC [Clostridiales Family XIII bacterium]|jgi:GTP-binding protein|nr:ribosome biogenesis GTP-binding protein YihA/YsxC [Clostridiales Family XIII bacterium]
MKIKSASFIKSATQKNDYPKDNIKEIAFCGRSNVGKSSLLNALTNNKKLAKVSGTPGKTRLINFFDINNGSFRIVDLPGYGFAKVGKKESDSWKKMIEAYLNNRENLISLIVLLDIRHKPTPQDIDMIDFVNYNRKGGIIVLTKIDKLSKLEQKKNIEMISKFLYKNLAGKYIENDIQLLPVSAAKKLGLIELLSDIEMKLKDERKN